NSLQMFSHGFQKNDNKVNVLCCHQSPDLNPIDNLNLKRSVRERWPTNLEQWARPPANYCEQLKEGSPSEMRSLV
uniref:Uncharacterized protein n=1 Tax=Poecilia reticulata TaxID=8081 RepID=A0A3P9QGX6_POERE